MTLKFVPASEYDDGAASMNLGLKPLGRFARLDEFPKTRAGRVDAREMRELARRVIEHMRPRVEARVASTLREAKARGVEVPARAIEDAIRTNCEPGSPLEKLYREAWGIPMANSALTKLALRFRESADADNEDDDDGAVLLDPAESVGDGDTFCSQCGRNSKGQLAQSEVGLANFKGKKARPFQPAESVGDGDAFCSLCGRNSKGQKAPAFRREGVLTIDFGAAERERVERDQLREAMNPSLRAR
jgi:uncharacterized Zn finger protein (UPF0148 family)